MAGSKFIADIVAKTYGILPDPSPTATIAPARRSFFVVTSCNLPHDRADPLVRHRIFTMTTAEYVDGELLER